VADEVAALGDAKLARADLLAVILHNAMRRTEQAAAILADPVSFVSAPCK
jgi:hypothetical protein